MQHSIQGTAKAGQKVREMFPMGGEPRTWGGIPCMQGDGFSVVLRMQETAISPGPVKH